MIVGGRMETELAQDAPDMLLYCAFGYPKKVRDSTVGTPFRHQGEHFPLARGQVVEGVAPSTRSNELLYQRRVDNRLSFHDPLESAYELTHVSHSVLEQVTNTLAAVEQLHRRLGLNVRRQHEYSDLGLDGTNRARRLEALGCLSGRHTDVDDHDVGSVLAYEREQGRGIARLTHDFVACAFEQACDAFAEKHIVIGQGNADSGHAG
jgi:hypothetical protein